MKLAAISFSDNQSISLDMEGVNHLCTSQPLQLEDGRWFMELLVRSGNGTVALQLVADAAEKLVIQPYG